MKRYVLIHDSALYGESTIPNVKGISATQGGYNKGTILNGNIVYKYQTGVGNRNFLQISTKDKFNGLYLPAGAVRETNSMTAGSSSSNAEGSAAAPTTSVQPSSAAQTATDIKSKMKNILTDKNVLGGAGIGLGAGIILGGLMGITWRQTAGIAAITTVLGGLVGNSAAGAESFSGAAGAQKRNIGAGAQAKMSQIIKAGGNPSSLTAACDDWIRCTPHDPDCANLWNRCVRSMGR